MAACAVERADLGIDDDFFIEKGYGSYTVLQHTAEGALRLIPDEKDGILSFPEIVLEMVADSARIAHAAG